MKVKYIIKPTRSKYEEDKHFTFGVEYPVLADYRKRQSGQKIQDNGFVVIDNQGYQNMLFSNQVEVIEDNEKCYVF